MSETEREFLNYMFEQLTGSIYTKSGKLWTEEYADKCVTMLMTMKSNVECIKEYYGSIPQKDMEYTIFMAIINITLHIDTSKLPDVANHYCHNIVTAEVYC
jgi:hypothetical protein